MGTNIIIILVTAGAIGFLAFMMSRSIRKFEAKPKGNKKKGKNRYMPEVRNPGKR